MVRLFTEEARLEAMLEVEAALAKAQAALGMIPEEAARVITERASLKYVSLERVKKIEQQIRHDVMAMVLALSEACGEYGGYVHYGATSYDIVDTAWGLILKRALEILRSRLLSLERTLIRLVQRYRNTVMVGRTHGQHALPITLGLKFAVWLAEVDRHIDRLDQVRDRVVVGKMTGAVGTQAAFGERGLELQRLVLRELELGEPLVTTQILQRDRYAELVCLLAILASSLDKFATEIRNLQRTEIDEIREAFDVSRQVGSTAMPHKRNPIRCERVSGLARVVRGLVSPALENVVSWHERDLANSSAERFLLPEALILVDYMVSLMEQVLSGLEVNEEAIRRNLYLTGGAILSERLVVELVKRGVGRQEAHELVRKAAMRAYASKRRFSDVVKEDPQITKYIQPDELDMLLDPVSYLGTTQQQIDRLLSYIRDKRGYPSSEE